MFIQKYDHKYSHKFNRVNKEIREPKVRLINFDGQQVGIVTIEEALRLASEAGLDLVEVAPNVKPPVCKLMDYGKYVFELRKKGKKSKQVKKKTTLKEIKLRPKIDAHDLQFKSKHIERFLQDGSKVKITIVFRGREIDFAEQGLKLLGKIIEEHKAISIVEKKPILQDRNMTVILSPSRQK